MAGFPSAYSFLTDDELEEERRLFYVAVTRAKRYLFLTYPINVYDKTSGMLLSKPSRFLDHVSSGPPRYARVGGGRRARGLGNGTRPLLLIVILCRCVGRLDRRSVSVRMNHFTIRLFLVWCFWSGPGLPCRGLRHIPE